MYCKASVHIVGSEEKKARNFGKGIVMLLERVDRFGTIKGATDDMGMSYSKAWMILNAAEHDLGVKLLTRDSAHGAELTAKGRELLTVYNDALQAAQQAADDVYQAYAQRLEDTGEEEGVPALARKCAARKLNRGKLSTVNRFSAIVTSIQWGDTFCQVKVDAGGGHILSAMLSREAIIQQNLEPGMTVDVIVNESALLLVAD